MRDKQTQWEKLPGSFNRKLCDESILAILPPLNSSGLFSAFHFKDGSTKIGEFTSMKIAQDAADQYAHKNKLTGAPIPDVDAFFAARAVYAAALDKARHIKDASLVSAVQLAQAEFVRTMGSKPVGQKVKYGEFDATVVKICVGSLSGMIDIRVQGGLICVGVTEVTRDRPGASEEAPVEALTRYEEQNAAEKIDGYYVPTPCEDAQHNTQPAVERARAECVKALERKIEQIFRLSIDKFFALTGRKSGTRAKQSPMAIEVKSP